eukprot:TRINITY_DN701_c0_g1_i3.p1 TRINITY_DN701_c0_g1~~TRINITY_DN701_c0_g1_i3.p1  ORF type:complete len:334 (+),score=49.27 TRINITY_DN701_c0_g1_i3:68-1069(+)
MITNLLNFLLIFSLLTLCSSYSSHQAQAKATDLQLVLYWGQDSAGNRYPNNLEKPLAEVCSRPGYDIIKIAFLIIFFDRNNKDSLPGLNFANHCGTTFGPEYPDLLNCSSSIGADIKTCQSIGRKVLLSLGGSSGAYGFTSDAQASSFALTIWNMFLGGSASGVPRPFGDAVIDGVDLDIEGGSPSGYATFVSALRGLMNRGNKVFYISGAPQCPFPDAYLGPKVGTALGDAGNSFDSVTVQFYNNYCSYQGGTWFWSSFQQWAEWSKNSVNSKVKIYLGLPASSFGASGGYIPPDELATVVTRLRSQYPDVFGGLKIFLVVWFFFRSNVMGC